MLRSGALPAGITYLEERTVGPSLGRDSIEDGLLAGLVGTALVVLVHADLSTTCAASTPIAALLLNVLLLFGGLAAFDATLTLPGIAGIILTIGMAVDANVLVFERIREELRAGRTVRSAIDLGFDKAFSSIVDTNVTTLIAAALPVPVRHRPDPGLRRHPDHRPPGLHVHGGLRQPLAVRPGALPPPRPEAVDLSAVGARDGAACATPTSIS